MRPQTTMTVYPAIVLECQNCRMICRLTDTAARRNCPSCGLDIANWDELMAAAQQDAVENSDATDEA